MTQTDEDAVTGCLAGQQTAFEELFQRHRARALRTALAIVGDRHAAEDVRQEAFLRAFRTLPRKQVEVGFQTWLYRCVVWSARTHAAGARRRLTSQTDPGAGRASDFDRAELRLELVGAMQELPMRLREVLTLRFYLDLPVEEVARILGCRPGTVKSRSSRGLQRLAASGHLAGFVERSTATGGPHRVPSSH